MKQTVIDNMLIERAVLILLEWADTTESFRYHRAWINRLDTSSKEKLFNDFKDKASGEALEACTKRIQYLLK